MGGKGESGASSRVLAIVTWGKRTEFSSARLGNTDDELMEFLFSGTESEGKKGFLECDRCERGDWDTTRSVLKLP